MSLMPLPKLLDALKSRGEDSIQVTLPQMEVGRFQRRNVRLLLAAARLDGVHVDAHEERGFIESVFLVHMEGSARLLHHHLSVLNAFVEAAERA